MNNGEQELSKVGKDDVMNEGCEYILRLFVTGASPNSVRAITNIKQVCESYLQGIYSLEIIDVYQQRSIAENEQIIALPLLIKTFPLPEKRLIGDMSDTKKVLRGLGITECSEWK